MKPLTVSMSAFGSYAGVEKVDFERLDHGIFLITGDTGAGKTTIFDAVAFALFGETSGQKRDGSMMRSQYAPEEAETSVTLRFEERDGIYEITRSPAYSRISKRKNKEGQYSTIQVQPKAVLKLPDGQEFPGSIREVNQKVQELLGVDYGQFSQICMIAQGDYLKLLHASSKERKDIFARIFNTGIFNRIQQKLRERNGSLYGKLEDNRKLCAHELSNVVLPEDEALALNWQELLRFQETGRDRLSEMLETILKTEREQERLVKTKRTQHQGRLTETENRIRQAGEVNELLGRLAAVAEKKEELEERAGIWKIRKQQLILAKKAAGVENVEKRFLDKSREEKECVLRIKLLEEEVQTLTGQRQAAQENLERCRKETEEALPKLNAGITRLRDAMPLYSGMKALRDAYGKKKVQEEEAKKNCEQLTGQLTLLQDTASEIAGQQTELLKESDRLAELMKRTAQQRERYEALGQLKQSTAALLEENRHKIKKQQAIEKAQALYEDAEQKYNSSYREFLTAQAGLMARSLEEGKACPVCGSASHPRKAQLSEEAVTQAGVEEAKRQRDRAESERAQVTEEGIQALERCRHRETVVCEEWQRLFGTAFCTEDAVEKVEQALEDCKTALDTAAMAEKKAGEAVTAYRKNQEKLAENEKRQRNLKAAEEKSRKEWMDCQVELAGRKAEISQAEQKLPWQDEKKATAELKQLETKAKQLENRQNEVWESAGKKSEEEKEKKGRLASEQESRENLALAAGELNTAYEAALQEMGFESKESYHEAGMPEERIREWEEKEHSFGQELLKIHTIYEQLKIQAEGKKEIDTASWQEQENVLREELEHFHEEESRIAGTCSRNEQAQKNLEQLWKERGQLEEEYRVIHSLYQTANGKLSGMAGLDFQTYVQRQYFKQMIQAANRRLAVMTGGQFILACRELDTLGKQGEVGLDLDVYSMVTDKIRDVKTLSGGESFMAALAMALGMADVIQNTAGNIRMDAMFIDEGFGSLDEETRMRAIRILQNLAGEKRLVGIISHVQELKDQIDRKLVVQKNEKGSRITYVMDEG